MRGFKPLDPRLALSVDNLPVEIEIDAPDEFWDLEDGTAVAAVVSSPEHVGEYFLFVGKYEARTVGVFPDGSSNRRFYVVR